MSYSDGDLVMWIRNRVVNTYGESPLTDFVQRLTEIGEKLGADFGPIDIDEPSTCLMVPREHIIDGGEFFYVMKRNMPEVFRQKRKGKRP